MDSSNVPAKIQLPFANGGTKNTIPVTPGVTPGLASFQQGFPSLTFTPLALGGIPPSGADMNGVLYDMTAIQQWQSAGGGFKYDAAFSTAVGGYPKGCTLENATNDGFWLNQVENNSSNPDLGGAGWLALPSYFKQTGSLAVTRSYLTKLKEIKTSGDWGTVGDGVADDTTKIANAIADLPQRGQLSFPAATGYKITSTIQIFNKAGAVLNFGNQLINASSFATPQPAIHFKEISQVVIDDIFVIGNTTNTNTGVLFDAASGQISIHAKVGKVNVSSCNTGIQVGTATSQFSDSLMEDLYASDCVNGIKFTGENTLAMLYGRVSAYNNTTIGVHFDQGGGTIESLQVAASGSDLYFGSTSGLNHNKLARWDILSGYSEEGVIGERFIDSALCSDTNPFLEQIAINGFRCTPFTSTSVGDFIRWRMNGDLILSNVTIGHGQQLPYISVDHNTAYRAPRVEFDGVIDCAPKTAVQVPMTYKLTDPRQIVEINARVNNGLSFWQNDGAANEGVIKRGIYMRKLETFEQALLNLGGLTGAWNLRDITSGTCTNLVLGKPSLNASAALERRDFWLDDGLIGFFRNSTTSKTISTSSSVYAVGTEYTFGMILRPTGSGTDETSANTLGGVSGIRIGIGDTGGAFVRCQVGAFNAQATPTNPLDPHLVIGRYTSSTATKVDAINLRTGEIVSAAVGAPASGSLTWVNGVSTRNDLCVRGFPFVYNRALTDLETKGLLQSALALTSSWRYA